MQITEIRVRLVPDNGQRLKAYCTITLDSEFVVRDLKIIEGNNGLFVAMPSRKLADRCNKCGAKNHLRARFCNECGAKLAENRILRDEAGKPKLNIDIAHPIDSQCRQRFEQAVTEAYHKELQDSQQPGYKPKGEDHLSDFFLTSQHDTPD
jgi:stage V sporulation protein G